MKSAWSQFRQHSVALVSLAVALSSLAYNTWRNEQTEANRNVRTAGVELLLQLGELERVVFFSHFDHDRERGNPRAGWAFVLTLKDLASLTAPAVDQAARDLHTVWQSNWDGLGSRREAEERISTGIDGLRAAMLETLAELD